MQNFAHFILFDNIAILLDFLNYYLPLLCAYFNKTCC